jgi:hypothetical protein
LGAEVCQSLEQGRTLLLISVAEKAECEMRIGGWCPVKAGAAVDLSQVRLQPLLHGQHMMLDSDREFNSDKGAHGQVMRLGLSHYQSC